MTETHQMHIIARMTCHEGTGRRAQQTNLDTEMAERPRRQRRGEAIQEGNCSYSTTSICGNTRYSCRMKQPENLKQFKWFCSQKANAPQGTATPTHQTPANPSDPQNTATPFSHAPVWQPTHHNAQKNYPTPAKCKPPKNRPTRATAKPPE